MAQIFDKEFLDALLVQAKENPRLRAAYDLRTTAEDASQRILNAVVPSTEVPIHRHPNSTENVLCLCGSVDEVFYDAQGKEVERIHLSPAEGKMGCVVPKGQWHTIEVHEPSVIYEGKDGKYGEDGTESFSSCECAASEMNKEDLKKQITYLIGKERADGNLTELTAKDISNLVHVPIEDVEQVMKEMGI
jgi:cupin fold WbuC family metalloprotein